MPATHLNLMNERTDNYRCGVPQSNLGESDLGLHHPACTFRST